jgi:Domain of unknown function (DUF3471)
MIEDYRGHRTLQHTRGVPGQRSAIAIVPGVNAAIAVLTNAESSAAAAAVLHRFLDHVLGLPSRDWIAAERLRDEGRSANARKVLAQAEASVRNATSVNRSGDVLKYAGDYEDKWYGRMSIEAISGELTMRFARTPTMTGVLDRWSRDTFRVHWDNRKIEDAYVTFSFRPDDTVDQVRMRAISPLADFSFDYQDLAFSPASKEARK